MAGGIRRWFKRLGFAHKEDRIIEYYMLKSSQALLQEQYGAAIRYLDHALEFRPKSNRIHLARGVILYQGMGKTAEALQCLKQAADYPADKGMKDEIARNRARDLIRKIMQGDQPQPDPGAVMDDMMPEE